MPNKIFRDRLINDIAYAIREAKNASEVAHPGFIGTIRELVVSKLLLPMLPAGFKIGNGKIVDAHGNQSAETDVVIYNRAVLPPVLYDSEREGVFPVESSYYAIEVKSCLTASEVQDAIRKGRTISALWYAGKDTRAFQHRALTVVVLFAFASDLAETSSEFDRYAQYDADCLHDPVVKAICVAGGGYWYQNSETNNWVFHPPSPEHDEIIDLVSGVVNTLLKLPPVARVAPLGKYLMTDRPAKIIDKIRA